MTSNDLILINPMIDSFYLVCILPITRNIKKVKSSSSQDQELGITEFPLRPIDNTPICVDIESQLESSGEAESQVHREMDVNNVDGTSESSSSSSKSLLMTEFDNEPHGALLLPTVTTNNDIHPSKRIFRKGSILVHSFLRRQNSSASTICSPKSCSICCEQYKVGDDICWSKNEMCKHAFHLDCVTHWLMTRHDCPLCRRFYLIDTSR